ncbi:hypothetical protein N8987_03380 [Crocinitomix sp.]|nr:hypothetical protein [Crocinitomix sp.]
MKKFGLLIFVGLVLMSCRKEEVGKYEGPSLEEMNTPFAVVTDLAVSQATVDFSAGEKVTFSAELSKTSAWQLRIIGETSGAEKIVTGTSKIIDATSLEWKGSTTNLPIFKAEMCQVELTFDGQEDTLIGAVEITEPKVNLGFVVADFESGFNPGWSSFIQSGLDMDFQVKSDGDAPEGDRYYNMAGIVDWDYLIGMVNFNADAYGGTHFPLNTNPNNVYFNVMVYGEPGLQNSIILFRFEEDENGDGSFNGANEDLYSIQVLVNWEGWQLLSFKYSDMVNLVDGVPAVANGNNTHNPDKLLTIDMLHLANPATGLAKSKLDYIIFTENGPLIP